MRISDSMPRWVTREYVEACDARDYHFRIYSNDMTEANLLRMKRSRNFATNLKNALKRDYFSRTLHESQGDSRRLWQTVKEAFGKKKSLSTPISKIGEKTDPAEIAETLNVYFSTIADDLANTFPQSTPTRTEPVKHQPKLYLSHVDDAYVEKMICELSLSTAVGTDGISPRVLKAAVGPLSILIRRLINKSIDSGIFPDGLKFARVSPVSPSKLGTGLTQEITDQYRCCLPFLNCLNVLFIHNCLIILTDINCYQIANSGSGNTTPLRPVVLPCLTRYTKRWTRAVSVAWCSWT